MTDLVNRLRQTTANMASFCSAPMALWQDHATVALQAASRIEALERENAELRAENDRLTEQAIVGEYMWTLAELNEALAYGRREALEEAAKVADVHGVYPELNVWAGGPEWYKHGRSIAAAIRALSVSSPTPLQEQNANMGKEGE